MNPVFSSSEPLECPICLSDTNTQYVRWHRPIAMQRVHSSCLDCATVIYQRAILDTQSYQKTLSCPECRKIISLESDRFVSKEVITTALKVSMGYMIMRFLAYPLVYSIAQMCLPRGTFFHLVSLWTYQDCYRPDWDKIQSAIALLVQADHTDVIVEELFNILSIIKKAGDFCLTLLAVIIAKHIHDKNYPSPMKYDVMMIALINLVFFGVYFHYTHGMNHMSHDEMTHLVKQGINPLKDESKSSLSATWIQDLLMGLMPVFSAAFIYMKAKDSDFEKPQNIKAALLNAQLLFSDEE